MLKIEIVAKEVSVVNLHNKRKSFKCSHKTSHDIMLKSVTHVKCLPFLSCVTYCLNAKETKAKVFQDGPLRIYS